MQDNDRTLGGANSAVIVGRAGRDPELKYFDSGSVKASFSLAVDRPGGSRENRETDWFNIDVWGRSAEVVGEYLKKGNLAAVSGRLSVRRWTDDAGNERDALSVVASDVRFLGGRRENTGGDFGYNNASGGERAPF